MSIKAAEGFVRSIGDAINSICPNPLRYQNTYKDVREYILKHYPYSLIYQIDGIRHTLIIIPVFHHRRNPAIKYYEI
ncbi:MAG: type II toxin-antitoxin system RelE/ParE family toxin [Chitinophagaceae bacterium]|nr:MAG: type II toxin-antitoxin system RelE/ParE family toxin [Chitinophagaceae bacterium]